MASNQRVFKLKGVVQNYSWGGYDFIPQLLNTGNKERKPFAEYWMGAHGNHPASIQNENEIALNDFIGKNTQTILGDRVAQKFSSLPYLFKVLDVRQMLSIQVHPSRQSAEMSFEEENKKRIPLKAPHRNYKDSNHKPELMVALGDFWLLHGFKSEETLVKILEAKEEFLFLKDIFQIKGYQGLYEEVMLMDQKNVNEILHPLLQKIIALYQNGSLQKDNEDFWAARATLEFCKNGNYDRGIFSIYFFNLVHLKKGQGIFQPAGLPHAYLEGQNVEVMANSDNVLRAGLTDKHIDVAELMKHVEFEPTHPKIINPVSNPRIFSSPAEEFELQQYLLQQNEEQTVSTNTAEIFLVMEGALEIKLTSERSEFDRGDSFFVTSETAFTIKALSEVNLFRVTVPGG
jgi:mannose-6-phosphate isomerase